MAVLTTMGELARVAGTQLRADVPEILPLVIDAIQDGSSQTKRLVAVSTLGQVRGAGAGRGWGWGGHSGRRMRMSRTEIHPARASSLVHSLPPLWPPPPTTTHTHTLRASRSSSRPGLWCCRTSSTRSCWACCCAC